MGSSFELLNGAMTKKYVADKEDGVGSCDKTAALLWMVVGILLHLCLVVVIAQTMRKKTVLDRFRPKDRMFVVDNDGLTLGNGCAPDSESDTDPESHDDLESYDDLESHAAEDEVK